VSTQLIKPLKLRTQTRLTSCRFRVGDRVGSEVPPQLLDSALKDPLKEDFFHCRERLFRLY